MQPGLRRPARRAPRHADPDRTPRRPATRSVIRSAGRSAPRHRAPSPRPGAPRLSPGPIGLLLAVAVLVVGSGAGRTVDLAAGSVARRPAAAPVVPVAPVAQPAGLEELSPYLPQATCNPVPMRGSTALGDLLRRTYPGTSYGVARSCGSDASEHYEGRAVDWMVSHRNPAQLAQAQAFLAWLLAPDGAGRPYANARRLGVLYVIWNDRIWGAYRAADGWRPYSSCAARPERASDTSCHRDHVHISLSWAGAAGRTSFWSGRVAATDYGPCRPPDLNWAEVYTGPRATPCPAHPRVVAPRGASPVVAGLYRASGARLGPGASGPLVSALQRGLGVTADGSFGPRTGAAVASFRARHGLRSAQVMDAAAWRALLRSLGTGAGTVATPAPAPTPSPKPAPKPAPKPTPKPTGPLAPYLRLVLSYGDSGRGVAAVQQLLGVTPTGWFGPRTRAAVKAFQTSRRIPATGTVGPLTWAALNRLALATW